MKYSKAEKNDELKDLKIRYINQLHVFLDKRIDALLQRNKILRKQKDLLNIYGQTFTPIQYGDFQGISSSNYAKVDQNENFPKTLKMNAELLTPLAEQLRTAKRLKQ